MTGTTHMTNPLTAWGDESGGNPNIDPGAYIVCATLVDEPQYDEMRQMLISLKPKAANKLHWYELSRAERQNVVEFLASSDCGHIVVVRKELSNEGDRKDKRNRSKCLEALYFHLERVGVRELTLESRGAKADLLDRNLLDTLKAKRSLGSGLKVSHLAGPAEPLLWAADSIAGAVSSYRSNKPNAYNQLKNKIEIIELSP